MSGIIVFGGANIDIKAKSTAPNLLGTSNPGEVSLASGGVGRNIAHNLARLGAEVAFVSVVGDDAHGEEVLAATSAAGVDISRVQRTHLPTGAYVALLDHDGEMITAMNDMRAIDELKPSDVRAHAEVIAAARFVVADCNLRQDTLSALAGMARGKLVVETVSVPKSRKLMALLAEGPVFLASPNFDQVEALAGTRDIADAFAFLHGKGLENAVLHAGAEGAFVSDGADVEHVDAQPPARIVDVTGAGDASVAGLVFGLYEGLSLADAAALGQQLAGRVIGSAASTLE
ncbi:MAG: carbohydrate kinase family protein [Hyphomicrobiales bacterium]